jgi:hypothetical protein
MPECCSGGTPTEIESTRTSSCHGRRRPTTNSACRTTRPKQRRSRGPGRTSSPVRARHPCSERSFRSRSVAPGRPADRPDRSAAPAPHTPAPQGTSAAAPGSSGGFRRAAVAPAARPRNDPESLARQLARAFDADENDQPSPLPIPRSPRSGVGVVRCQSELPPSRRERASPPGWPGRVLWTSTRSAGGDSCLLEEGAVLAHRLVASLAAELDDDQQS